MTETGQTQKVQLVYVFVFIRAYYITLYRIFFATDCRLK
ncbi:hypothetical protein D1AOALGA4SA_11812 [Olavius algarvensis Delta 1 endosymbiont]|nr:hypothetical protein D1AOALGA4SA_11812 [Olavius algarvensis Delta 1 endosymbiont]